MFAVLVLAAGTAASALAETEPPTEVVVAAANSRVFEKQAADFVCTGTNDEAVINAAIARLKYGGTVRLAGAVDALLPGSYPLVTSASINLGSAHWTCVDSLSRYSLRIVARATSLDLSVAVKGTTVLFK